MFSSKLHKQATWNFHSTTNRKSAKQSCQSKFNITSTFYEHTLCSNLPTLPYLLRNMSLSKQARKRAFQESWEEKYFCCAQDDNVRCLLCSIVQKGTHKWNIKRHYDTVLCSKSAPDAANLVYPFSHYATRIAGCVVRHHCEATLSTWLPMPDVNRLQVT